MPLVPFAANKKFRPVHLNAAVDDAIRTRHQTADQTRNNTTEFLDSPDLVFPVEAGAVYAFKARIFYSSDIAAGFIFGFAAPLGTTYLIGAWTSSGTAIDSALYHSASGSAVFAEGAGVGTMKCCRPVGTIFVGNRGILTGQFAQNAATASETRLKLGSSVRLSRVA